MNTYLSTPNARDKLQANREAGQRIEPVEVEWRSVSVPVDRLETPFEVCEFPQGWWAAIGRVPDAVITIDSRGVPLDGLRLERVLEYPVPALPDLGEVSQVVGKTSTLGSNGFPCGGCAACRRIGSSRRSKLSTWTTLPAVIPSRTRTVKA